MCIHVLTYVLTWGKVPPKEHNYTVLELMLLTFHATRYFARMAWYAQGLDSALWWYRTEKRVIRLTFRKHDLYFRVCIISKYYCCLIMVTYKLIWKSGRKIEMIIMFQVSILKMSSEIRLALDLELLGGWQRRFVLLVGLVVGVVGGQQLGLLKEDNSL